MWGFEPHLDNYADPEVDLERYIHHRTSNAIAEWRDRDPRTLDELAALQERVREAVLGGIGGLPEFAPGPPPVQHHGFVTSGGLRIERLRYESLPGVWVPANMYRPSDPSGAGVIMAAGHSRAGKADPRYHSVCVALAERGITVLAVDPHGQGERIAGGWRNAEARWGVDDHLHLGVTAWWAGQSLMRWMVADLIRGVDLLIAQDEIDPTRLGITGSSGGATQLSIAMTLDQRLHAAAPATYLTSRLAYQRAGQIQDPEQHLLGGTAAGVDHADLVMAWAPRPVRILAAEWDFFPLAGTHTSVTRAQQAYRLYGAADSLSCVTDSTLHAYSPGLERAAADFFAEVLAPSDSGGAVTANAANPAEAVAVIPRLTHPDEELPVPEVMEAPQSRLVDDLIRAELSAPLSSDGAPDFLVWLKNVVEQRRVRPVRDQVRWVGTKAEPHLIWDSEVDLWGAGILLPDRSLHRDRGSDPAWPQSGPEVLQLFLLPHGTASDAETLARAQELAGAGRGPQVVLDLRAMGALAPRKRGSASHTELRGYSYKLLCDLLWLGDSLAAGRVFDLCRAVEVLTTDAELRRRWPGLPVDTKVEVVAVGGLGRWHGELAAALEPRITTVIHDGATIGVGRAASTGHWCEDADATWAGVLPGVVPYLNDMRDSGLWQAAALESAQSPLLSRTVAAQGIVGNTGAD